MHPEEALDGVAVLHGGAPVAVDQGARLLTRHPGAVGDLLLGVFAPVGLEPGAAQQIQALEEAGLQIGFPGGAPAQQGPHHGLGDAGLGRQALDVENLGLLHIEPVGECGDPGHDGRQ